MEFKIREKYIFIKEYLHYLHNINGGSLCMQWLKGFGDEILQSKVNQVSLILGFIGIASAILLLLQKIAEYPGTTIIVLASALAVMLALTMFYFWKYRTPAAPASEQANQNDFTSKLMVLLRELYPNHCKTKSEISEILDINSSDINEFLDWAEREKWLIPWSGTWKINEAMKPIVALKLRSSQ